jgi:hypothetical protein
VDSVSRILVITMSRKPNDGYNQDATDTLNDAGVLVEPDVRDKIKKYLKAMGLTNKKIKVSELRQAIRSALSENLGEVPLKCPGCGSRNVGTWSIAGNIKDPDWAECKKCGASGRLSKYEIVEASNTMGRMNFITSDDKEEKDEQEALEEFADWSQGFQDNYNNKRYEMLARQIYNNWPNHGADVDWAKVIDLFLDSRMKNLHTELDKDKLYEKVLNLAEDHFDGSTPPVAQSSQHQYGGTGSGSA